MITSSTPSDLERFISGLVEGAGCPDLLLQHLCEVQERYNHVSPEAVSMLSSALGVAAAQVQSVVEFYAFLHGTPRGDFNILFSDNITDRMLGNQALLQRLCKKLHVEPGAPRADGRVTVDTTSCTGMCDQGPALLVNGLPVTRVNERRIDQIAQLVNQDRALPDWPREFFQVDQNIQSPGLLLEHPYSDGAALLALADLGADRMLQTLDTAGLRGRGGAGFGTAAKWRFCRNAAADSRVVVCNADEGEPGTFKDRVLLQGYADRVVEGMTLCAGIVGANRGYLYLRGEYRYLVPQLHDVLEQRRQKGLLGRGILGIDGMDFDIDIHLGAGAYVCGEESALIESLEGKRGIPRKRPPFPVTHGYLGRPTVVNNVETFMAAAAIAVTGSDWFRSQGTDQSTGSKLLSISGDCARPGVYEFPFGTRLDAILAECGADNVQALQVGGAAGSTLSASEFSRSIAFEDVATAGSFMVFHHDRDLLEMVRNFSDFFVHESCGFCTPCRVGGPLLRDLVLKVLHGHGTNYDLEEMRALAELMRSASHCGLGHTAPNPVLDSLEKFPHVYQQRLRSVEYEPAFDLDAALTEARALAGRSDPMEKSGDPR